MTRLRTTCATLLLLIGSTSTGIVRPAEAQEQHRSLAREDIILYGAGLRVEPARQTLPRDIATIVSTLLQAPNSPDLPPFPTDAEVRATLRGPSFAQPLELTGQPNGVLNIPPLTVAGLHTVDSIRVVSNGQVLLYGVPESVEIDVIDRLLVTQVTARPLSAAEIREAGLIFDKTSFQAYNFAAAFAVDSGPPIQISFPVVLPTLQGAGDVGLAGVDLNTINPPLLRDLSTIIPDTLKLQTRMPNLSVVGFTLKVPDVAGQNFFVPPIPGVVVIPGDIGFLNQFFSVLLMVANVAPGGSNLVVSDLQAQIVLPPGTDTVVGSADDPLRMASTATGETPRTQPVQQPGPDGRLGTGDDVVTLGPGETGNAEYLVEGRREGSHIVEMELTGTLTGLPIGPVPIRGRAAGAVLVRNPTFTLTFTHPEIVNAGEPYSLDVTITNTSLSPANFVSLNLYGRNVSGASIVGEPTREVESIPAGDSATVTFDLISRITGRVTAATLDSDENVAGRFGLKTAVGELGVPLSPDSLVLPKEASALPKALRDAALGLLGKAYAVATAPAAALPRDVRRFSKKIVWDRAVEVAEAGFRFTLHEPMPDTAAQLLMDFAGSSYARLAEKNPLPADLAFAQDDVTGFDEIRRRSVRGNVFAQTVAQILSESFTTLGTGGLHAHLATQWSYRAPHLSVMVGGTAGSAPPDLILISPTGERLGPSGTPRVVERGIPFSDHLTFGPSDAPTGSLALVATTAPGEHVIRIEPRQGAPPDARFDLSVIVPNADGTLRQIRFDAVPLTDGPVVAWSGSEAIRFRVEVVGATATQPRAPSLDSPVIDPAPAILGVVQFADGDALTCEGGILGRPGRVISVLFSEEVTPQAVQDRLAAADLTHFAVDGNAVVGVALQPGRRIAFLALRDPVGPLVPRQLTVTDVVDRRGQAMATQSLPIEATVTDNAGVVSGQVIRADGTPVAFANVRLLYTYVCGVNVITTGISSKSADDQGRYSWDFVLKDHVTTKLVAIDPENGEFKEVRFSVARHAQRLNVNIVFLGRGTLTGRVVQEDGLTVVPGAAIRVTSLTDQSQYGATTGLDGRFAIAAIPVGSILIEAVSTTVGAQTFISESIPFAGATVTRDISLLDVDTTGVQVAHGRLIGHVIHEDGTPVVDVPIVAYYQNRSQVGVRCPPAGLPPTEPPECAIAVVRTDAAGAFAFENLTSGSHRMYAVDQAALQEGQARIALQPNAVFEFNLVLAGGLGSVRGRVVDPAGVGVANASVGGGLSLTTANANGEFLLTDVPVGRRSIGAASNELGATGSAEIDIIRPGDEVNVTIVLQSTASVSGTILAFDGVTVVPNIRVYLFTECDEGICVAGEATSNAQGGYRIDRVPLGTYQLSAFRSDFSDGNIRTVSLSYFRQVFRADVRFRGGSGRVTGVVFDDDGVTPLRASVSISGDQLVIAGGRVGASFQYVQNVRIVQTDFTTGRFSLGGGVWVGPFTVRAAGQFSPDPVSLESNMPAAGATVDLTLRLQATSQIAGVVHQPDGVTPVGADVIVRYKSDAVKVFCAEDASGDTTCTTIPQGIQEEVVVTNAQGEYWLPIVNAGAFTLTAEDPVTGRVGRVAGAVRSGERAELAMRLVGLGQITIHVRGSDSVSPIPGARVEVQQLDYPNKVLTGYVADVQGNLQLAGGDAFSEGQFVVNALDVRNGFAGRTAGRITSDGETVVVNVFLFNATGTVSGHVFRADGATPVPNAEVVISNATGPLAFAVTDADGAYQQDTIPLGIFQVDVFEAATAARAFATGRIDVDHQVVPLDVTLAALGVVRGIVLEAGSQAPLKGWQVTLQQLAPSGLALPQRVTNTGVDGGFSFPGTSVGSFQMTASRSGVNGFVAVAGAVARPGAVVEVPMVVAVIRQAFGRIQGTVFDAGGAPAGNSQVRIDPGGRTVTADADGHFFLELVPLGRFLITARSQTTNNIGTQWGELSFDGATVDVPVTLVGLGEVAGTVRHADGSAAAGVEVTLTGSPATGCAGPCIAFTSAAGTFSFAQLAARTFSVTARDPVSGLRGSIGDTLNPGEIKQVAVVLQPSQQITGRVLSTNGRPAPGIVAELTRGSQRLFVETGEDGTFLYPSVVIGAHQLTVTDPIGPGLARRSINVTGDVALGDIVLDENDPTVVEMTPQNFAIGVPRTTPLTIRFSEPVAAGTVNSSNVVLSNAAGPLGAVVTLGSGDTVATITPIAALSDQTAYTISVTGIQDRLGKTMRTPFTGSFITEDVTAPLLRDAVPGTGVQGVTIYTTVRLSYSEGLDTTRFTGAPVGVVGPGGPVAGRLDFLFGNTVVVFTPNIPLAENTSYTVTVAAAVDLAGNRQAAGSSFAFATTDRTPPSVLALTGPGSVIENDIVATVAGVGAADVAVVDFFVNDVFVAAARSLPFTLRLQAAPVYGMPGQQIRIHAVATDTSGNRGPASAVKNVAVIADQPPIVTIAPPPSGLSARNGERVTVQVTSIDDLGSTQIAFRATTSDPRDAASREIQPASTSRTETFGFNIPATAPPGSTIQIQASAVDTSGHTSQAVPLSLTVTDATPPATSITGVSTGDRVRPGQRATAIVVATDLGGIASVGFTVSGAATLTETRAIAPSQNSVGVAFAFDVSSAARPTDSVVLDAFAVDGAGNRTNAARVILPVADGTPPTVRIRTANGRLDMVPGRPVEIVVDASDELAISRLELTGQGAFTLSTARQVSPPLGSASATFAVDVPATTADGAQLTLQARAVDLSGNVSTPVNIVLTARAVVGITLPPSAIVIAGETAEVLVMLSAPAPAGGLLVELISANANVAGLVTPSITFAEGESSRSVAVTGISGGTVAVNALVQNVQRASMTVTVRGGVVRGTVLSPQLTPIPGAQVTVTGAGPTLTDVTDGEGRYFVEGASGAVTVTVRALDPQTQLLGYATGQMTRQNGFVTVNVVLISAGMLDGQVVDPLGVPVGPNVQVTLFNAGALTIPVSSTFTDAEGRWLFPLVAIGTYVIDAIDTLGNHGRSSASITASGQEVTVPVTYLGRGVVRGTVRNAAGAGAPNASVTLQATSLFGAAPAVTRIADADGAFRFDGVFVGSFSVSATDPISGLGGGAAGAISAQAQEVEANIGLAAAANLQGTIFRADGTTPVGAGATVLLQYCLYDPRCNFSTTTDAAGRYAFSFLPLGSFTVSVSEPATRGKGGASGSVTVNGETRTLNINLLAQGSLVVTVRNANDVAIPGASVVVVESLGGPFDTISATTDTNGQVVIERVLAGGVTITASAGGLSGQVNGTLAPNAVLPVAVRLEATATIRGTMFAPDGQTPTTGGSVTLNGLPSGYPFYSTPVGADGAYSLSGVRLNNYDLRAYDEAGRLRVIVRGIALSANGQIETRDLVQVGLGTVSGRVINPDSSSAPSLAVSIQSLNATFGGFFNATTGAAGFYQVANVPVGDVFVRAGDAARNLLGEGRGTLAPHGAELVVDILLQNNAVSPVGYRYDANGSPFYLQQDGSTLYSLGNVFLGAGSLSGGFKLELSRAGATTAFTGSTIGTLEDGGREIAIRQPVVGTTGLDVTRKIFVPQDGYFARYLEILTNPTASAITVDVRVLSHLRTYQGSSQVRASSDGDAQLNLGADHWVTLDDNTDGDPYWVDTGAPVAFVFDAAGAPVGASGLSYAFSRTLTYQWQVTIPANGKVTLMHFGVQQTSRAAAAASATRLVQLPPEALAGLSPEELATIGNFVVPTDGLSTLAPLPRLDGRVTGRVLEGDGSTPVPNAQVRFLSTNPFFARRLDAYANASGVFTIAWSTGNRTAVATDAFTLVAQHSQTSNLSSPVSGLFNAGEATAAQDVTFSNLARVSGVLRRHDGTAVTSAFVRLSNAGFNQQRNVTSDGSFSFAGLLPGTFTFFAEKSHTQGTGVRNQPATVSVAAAQSASVVLLLQPTGTLQGTLRTGAGVVVPNRSVNWYATGFSRAANTDTSGRFTSSEMPVGVYSLQSYDPVVGIYATRQFEITQDQTTTADLSYVGLATVNVTVTRANGAPAANVQANVSSYNNPSFSFGRNQLTDANGVATFTDVPVGPYRALAYPQSNSQLQSTTAPFSVDAAGAVVPVALTLTPYGSVRGRVTFGSGAVATNQQVRFASALFYRYAYTNSTGDYVLDGIPLNQVFSVDSYRSTDSLVIRTLSGQSLATDGEELVADLVLPAIATVRLTVLRANGQAWAGAYIYSSDTARPYLRYRGATNALGQLDLANVPEGVFDVSVRDPNNGLEMQITQGQIVPANDGTLVNLTVNVTALSGNVEGTVFAADGSTPLANAYVQALTANGSYLAYAFADANGVYRFTDIFPGPAGFLIRAYTPSYTVSGDAAGSFTVYGETQTVNVVVPVVLVTLSGHVFLGDGTTPVPDASVSLYSSTSNYLSQVTPDAQGAFAFPAQFLPVAGVVLRVYVNDGDLLLQQPLVLPALGGAVTVDVVVPVLLGTVSGIVTAADGTTRLPDAYVQAYYDVPVPPDCECSGRIYLGQMSTDSEGRFQFANILAPVDGFVLLANSPGFTATAAQIVIFPAQNAVVDNIVLAVPVSLITGRVTFSNGDPVGNPTVFVTSGGGTRFATTDALGGYRVEGVPEGPFTMTAQHASSGLAVSIDGAQQALGVQRLDAVLPPSNVVQVRTLRSDGTPLPSVYVVLQVTGFQRYLYTDANGIASFGQVAVGESAYAQGQWYESSAGAYQYASDAAVVGSGGTQTLTLQFGGGGTVTGIARDASGAPLSGQDVTILAFGSLGPLGYYQRYRNTDAAGAYQFTNVPAGLVQVIGNGFSGLANGTVTAGATTTINVTAGNAVPFRHSLIGADGFEYDVGEQGYLSDGGTADGRLSDAYDRMYEVLTNGQFFSYVPLAETEDSGRELVLGPRPSGRLLVRRKVFVPAAGGFARYLEIVTNPTETARDVDVVISGNLGSDSSTAVHVDPVATNNTYAVTFENRTNSSDPALAHVFAGAGAVAVAPVAYFAAGDDEPYYSWHATIPAGGTAVFMHFAVQREPTDLVGAETQAIGLVNLTDPNALAGLSAAERAAIRNFILP